MIHLRELPYTFRRQSRGRSVRIPSRGSASGRTFKKLRGYCPNSVERCRGWCRVRLHQATDTGDKRPRVFRNQGVGQEDRERRETCDRLLKEGIGDGVGGRGWTEGTGGRLSILYSCMLCAYFIVMDCEVKDMRFEFRSLVCDSHFTFYGRRRL